MLSGTGRRPARFAAVIHPAVRSTVPKLKMLASGSTFVSRGSPRRMGDAPSCSMYDRSWTVVASSSLSPNLVEFPTIAIRTTPKITGVAMGQREITP